MEGRSQGEGGEEEEGNRLRWGHIRVRGSEGHSTAKARGEFPPGK